MRCGRRVAPGVCRCGRRRRTTEGDVRCRLQPWDGRRARPLSLPGARSGPGPGRRTGPPCVASPPGRARPCRGTRPGRVTPTGRRALPGCPARRPGARGRAAACRHARPSHNAGHGRRALHAGVPRPARCAHHPGRTFLSRRAAAARRARHGSRATPSCPAGAGHLAAARRQHRRPGSRNRGLARTRRHRVRLTRLRDCGRIGRGSVAARRCAARRCAARRCAARRRTDGAEQVAVVDETGHALSGERPGEAMRIDRKVGARVPADRVKDAGGIPGDHLDMAVEQHPVARLGLVAVAERMPAMVRLRVLQDRDDPRRGGIGIDADIGPLVQWPRIARASGHPAFLARGLGAQGQREAREGGTRFTMIHTVNAVFSPDKGFHFGRGLVLRHPQVVVGDVDDGRPQRPVARRHRYGRLGRLRQRQQMDRHPGR